MLNLIIQIPSFFTEVIPFALGFGPLGMCQMQLLLQVFDLRYSQTQKIDSGFLVGQAQAAIRLPRECGQSKGSALDALLTGMGWNFSPEFGNVARGEIGPWNRSGKSQLLWNAQSKS